MQSLPTLLSQIIISNKMLSYCDSFKLTMTMAFSALIIATSCSTKLPNRWFHLCIRGINSTKKIILSSISALFSIKRFKHTKHTYFSVLPVSSWKRTHVFQFITRISVYHTHFSLSPVSSWKRNGQKCQHKLRLFYNWSNLNKDGLYPIELTDLSHF